VSIVIVNWNSGKLLERCVKSIKENHFGIVDSVIIIDNASSDGSDLFIQSFPKNNPSITLLKNEKNKGFASACNQGAKLSNSI
jgi:GT2 family glycosyltransferase